MPTTQTETLPVETSNTPAKPQKTRYTPTSDADLLTVAQAVSGSWAANSAITLLWVDQPAFAGSVTSYKTSIAARQTGKSNRGSQTFSLKDLDNQIDNAVKQVKKYINYKFKADGAARAQYGRYGIVNKGGYKLPTDRDERKNSLPLMLDAINADGLGSEEFGTAFWTAMITDYKAALDATRKTDSLVSKNVGSKNEQKDFIIKVMGCLRLAIQANYPDTFRTVYRDWGWQKEDY